MKLSELNDWIGVVANIGVLTGIFFLASEIQQSNRIGTNQAEIEISQMFNEINRVTMDYSDLMVKLQQPDPELSEPQTREAAALAIQFMNAWGSVVSAYENGLITELFYRVRILSVGTVVRAYPGLAPYFESSMLGDIGFGTPELYEALRTELENLRNSAR